MDEPRWLVLPMRKADQNNDSRNDQFFASTAEAIVREALQNSLDAWIKLRNARPHQVSGSVRVRMALGECSRQGAADAYLFGLREHLAAISDGGPELGGPSIPFLSIEDFGTPGLEGNPDVSWYESDDPDAQGNDFFYFWRNMGRSSKGAQQMGRFGLGKSVFALGSRARCFVGVSRRASDDQSALMGMTFLKTHAIDGKRYYPYGYYGVFDADEFALPVTDPRVLDQVSNDFGLTRSSGPGLSVVVPWPLQTITADQLVTAVVRHFSYAVLSGKLEVTVEWPGGHLRLHESTILGIENLAASQGLRLELGNARALMDLAFRAAAATTDEFVSLRDAAATGAPEWSDSLLPEEALEAARVSYDAVEPLAFRVPLTVWRLDGTKVASEFKAFIQRRSGTDDAVEHYVREYLSLPDMKARAAGRANAMLLVDGPELSSLLGDSENPAHTKWNDEAEAVKTRYRYARATVRFVRRALEQLVTILGTAPAVRDPDLLKHIFGLPRAKAHEGRGPKPLGPDIDVPAPDRDATVHQTKGGFVVRPVPGKDLTGRVVEIHVAYDLRRGDPLKHYSRHDFVLNVAPVQVFPDGARKLATNGNVVRLEVQRSQFEVRVTGFDTRRDLYVQTKVVGGDR